jgi:hypothetical protein
VKEPQQQPISINVTSQPLVKPEGGFDPWQRYVKTHKLDIPTIAHRFLTGAVGGMAISSALLSTHAEFYWFGALLLPLVAMLFIKPLRTLDSDLFVIGSIAGIIGALL